MTWFKNAYLSLRAAALRPFYIPDAKDLDLGSIRSVIVLRYDRIGDMVQATPLIGALREEFPDAKITVLSSEENVDVLLGNPNVDSILRMPARGQDAFIDRLNQQGYDLLIDTYLSYDWAWTRIAAKINARLRLCLDLHGRGASYNIRVPAPLPPMSAAESMLEICRRGLKRPFRSRQPEIFLQKRETESARKALGLIGLNLSRPVVLLHPGGHYQEQRWPIEKFTQLATGLNDSGLCSTALVGGPKDEPLLGRALSIEPRIRVLETGSLRELIAAISCARLLVCNNSGPLHLAIGLRIPTVSTLGPTDKVLWAPRGEVNRVLVRNPLEELRVDEMFAEVRDCLIDTRNGAAKAEPA